MLQSTTSSHGQEDDGRRQSSITTTTFNSTHSSGFIGDDRRSSSVTTKTFSSDQGYDSEQQSRQSLGSVSSMIPDEVFFRQVIPNRRRNTSPGPRPRNLSLGTENNMGDDDVFFNQVLPHNRRNSSPGIKPRRFTPSNISHSHIRSHRSLAHVRTNSLLPGVHHGFQTPVQPCLPGRCNCRRVSLPIQQHICTPSTCGGNHEHRTSFPTKSHTLDIKCEHVAPYAVVPLTTQTSNRSGRSRTPWTPTHHLTNWLDEHINKYQ